MSYTGGKLINPSSDLPYQLLDTQQNVIKGLHKATGTFNFSYDSGGIQTGFNLGFKMGPFQRIENCTITIPNQSYSVTFGINSNWDLIGYFPTSDININSQGIGRAGSGNLGNGWSADICGFYLNTPAYNVLTADRIIVEYDFFTDTQNKHGFSFYPGTTQPSGVDGDLYKYLGTWGNSPYFRLPTDLTAIAYVNRTSFASGTRYTRKITIKNNIP
jgi:hypothetical protein